MGVMFSGLGAQQILQPQPPFPVALAASPQGQLQHNAAITWVTAAARQSHETLKELQLAVLEIIES